MSSLQHCRGLDRDDPLAPLRAQFRLPPGVIYLDGNSLGALPAQAPQRVAEVVENEWGEALIRSWNSAGWIALPQRVGDKIGRLVGARPGECIAADSTSVNLFKLLSAALALARKGSPQRRLIVSERSNFPTDLYIAQSLAAQQGCELRLLEADEIAPRLQGELREHVAVLMLTQVNYRTGRLHDMSTLGRLAHEAGALVLWDLAHSAGALPVDLNGDDADFAVGCGYKYLNGGPGAPAFLWVHPRHAERFVQPLSGWMGHARPFAFDPGYEPAPGVARYLCGTPSVIALAALECGVDTVLAAEALGGMGALRAKSLALTDLFIALVEERCSGHGLQLVTPREHVLRGSQVCLTREGGGPAPGGDGSAYAIVQALIARGVIGDFRAGDPTHAPSAQDILRFGFTPLTLRFEDVWHAVEHLRQVLDAGEWREPRFLRRAAVT